MSRGKALRAKTDIAERRLAILIVLGRYSARVGSGCNFSGKNRNQAEPVVEIG